MNLHAALFVAWSISSFSAFAFEGFHLSWNTVVASIAGPLVTLILFLLGQRALRAKEYQSGLDKVSELTIDERQSIRDAAAVLRREEREYMERVVAGHVKDKEIARARSHILANGYNALNLAHQQLLQLAIAAHLEIPPALYMQDAAARVVVQLETVTENELSNMIGGD